MVYRKVLTVTDVAYAAGEVCEQSLYYKAVYLSLSHTTREVTSNTASRQAGYTVTV